MPARSVFASLCLVFLMFGGAHSQTGCYGVNCPPTYDEGIGDLNLFELHQQLGISDQWVGRTQWRAVTGTEPETREQCFARCASNLTVDLGLCMTTHGGVPNPGEDPWTTLGRDNCFNYARQEHIRCLAPAQIAACPPN